MPEDAKYKQPDRIVFASDDIIYLDQNALKQLIIISTVFKSQLYVVKVIKNNSEVGFEVSVTGEKLKTISKIPGSSVEYLVDADITHGLNEFIKKHNADMLIMRPHRHNWLEQLFIKSETKNMIFHTHIPLLVLPEIEINRVSKPQAPVSSIENIAP